MARRQCESVFVTNSSTSMRYNYTDIFLIKGDIRIFIILLKPVKFLFPRLNCITTCFHKRPRKSEKCDGDFLATTHKVKKCAKKREDQYGKSFCSKKFIAII